MSLLSTLIFLVFLVDGNWTVALKTSLYVVWGDDMADGWAVRGRS